MFVFWGFGFMNCGVSRIKIGSFWVYLWFFRKWIVGWGGGGFWRFFGDLEVVPGGEGCSQAIHSCSQFFAGWVPI